MLRGLRVHVGAKTHDVMWPPFVTFNYAHRAGRGGELHMETEPPPPPCALLLSHCAISL